MCQWNAYFGSPVVERIDLDFCIPHFYIAHVEPGKRTYAGLAIQGVRGGDVDLPDIDIPRLAAHLGRVSGNAVGYGWRFVVGEKFSCRGKISCRQAVHGQCSGHYGFFGHIDLSIFQSCRSDMRQQAVDGRKHLHVEIDVAQFDIGCRDHHHGLCRVGWCGRCDSVFENECHVGAVEQCAPHIDPFHIEFEIGALGGEPVYPGFQINGRIWRVQSVCRVCKPCFVHVYGAVEQWPECNVNFCLSGGNKCVALLSHHKSLQFYGQRESQPESFKLHIHSCGLLDFVDGDILCYVLDKRDVEQCRDQDNQSGHGYYNPQHGLFQYV